MASDIANFRIGSADITLNAVAIGHTKGGVEITVTPAIHEKKVDQYGESPVGVTVLGHRIEIKCFFAESDLTHINKAIAGSTLTTGATKNEVGIGKDAGQALTGVPLLIHPRDMAAVTDLDWNFASVVPIGAPTFAFKTDEDRVYEVLFLALLVPGGTDGEKIVHIGTSN